MILSGETSKSVPNGTKWKHGVLDKDRDVGIECIYNANGIWVIGSNSGRNNNSLYYSIDGKTWTRSNVNNNGFSSVYNANGIWVAGSTFGSNGNEGFYYSTDGMTWTQSNITTGSSPSIYNANGIWVAGDYNNKGLYYSESYIPS